MQRGVIKLCECGCGRPAPVAVETSTRQGRIKGKPLRFVHGHNTSKGPLGPAWWTVSENGCWIWNGSIRPNGYGQYKHEGAHVAVYRMFKGTVNEGFTLDHTCHSGDKVCAGGTTCGHRRCVNPDHLEPVTCCENNRRGRSCKLTRETVDLIKTANRKRGSIAKLADEFGVSHSLISMILHGKRW